MPKVRVELRQNRAEISVLMPNREGNCSPTKHPIYAPRPGGDGGGDGEEFPPPPAPIPSRPGMTYPVPAPPGSD